MKPSENKHRLIWLLAAAALTAALVLCARGVLSRQALADTGLSVNELNEYRSQQLLTGEGYILDEEQEQEQIAEQQREEEYQEERQEEIEQLTPPPAQQQKTDSIVPQEDRTDTRPQDTEKKKEGSGGGTTEDPDAEKQGNPDRKDEEEKKPEEPETKPKEEESKKDEPPTDPDPTEPEEPEDKRPVIESSLADGMVVSGTDLNFTVRAVDYKNRTLDAFDLSVWLNGDKLVSSGQDGNGWVTYRVHDLAEGENEIRAAASDREGNTAELTWIVISEAQEPVLTEERVTLIVEADNVGLGTLLETNEEIYEGEGAAHFVDRVLREYYSFDTRGSVDSGYYLARIYGVWVSPDTVQIPDWILANLEEFNPSEMPYSEGSLGEKDIYQYSGWVYLLNGGYAGQSMSAETLHDGDEIHIGFTLCFGYEYDGTW